MSNKMEYDLFYVKSKDHIQLTIKNHVLNPRGMKSDEVISAQDDKGVYYKQTSASTEVGMNYPQASMEAIQRLLSGKMPSFCLATPKAQKYSKTMKKPKTEPLTPSPTVKHVKVEMITPCKQLNGESKIVKDEKSDHRPLKKRKHVIKTDEDSTQNIAVGVDEREKLQLEDGELPIDELRPFYSDNIADIPGVKGISGYQKDILDAKLTQMISVKANPCDSSSALAPLRNNEADLRLELEQPSGRTMVNYRKSKFHGVASWKNIWNHSRRQSFHVGKHHSSFRIRRGRSRDKFFPMDRRDRNRSDRKRKRSRGKRTPERKRLDGVHRRGAELVRRNPVEERDRNKSPFHGKSHTSRRGPHRRGPHRRGRSRSPGRRDKFIYEVKR